MDIRPNPTGNLAAGTNIAENLLSMRLDPTATCVALPEHIVEGEQYLSVKDIIRTWCFDLKFNWTMATTVGTQLYSDVVSPGWKRATDQNFFLLPLLDVFANYYMYYHGEVEYRFDFICNQFHTGMVTIAYIPYNDDFTADQATSGYWKMVDLREQKSFTFTVPYINSTVNRLTRNSGVVNKRGIAVPSPGSIKMFVTNPLNPIENVSTTIEVVVFKRAAPNFTFSYPKPVVDGSVYPIILDRMYYGLPPPKPPPPPPADAQMQDGESEAVDNTADFPMSLPGAVQLQTNEDHMNIKDIMRRWVARDYVTVTGNTDFFIPLTLWTSQYSPIQRSLQTAIARQFRYYRGSLRFMFIFSNSAQNIFITHIPQNGFLTRESMKTSRVGSGNTPHFNSMATQVCVPSINPIMKIEVPFHGVYDYLDMQPCYGDATYGTTLDTVYDKVATNLGHLVVQGDKDFTFHLFMAAGDDCEFIKFSPTTGVDSYKEDADKKFSKIDSTDNEKVDGDSLYSTQGLRMIKKATPYADAQMDDGTELNDPIMAAYTGPTTEQLPTSRISGFCSSAYRRITDSMTSTLNPYVDAVKSFKNIPKIEKSILSVASKADDMLEYIKDASNNIVAGIKSTLNWVTNTGAIFSSLLHFFQALINPKWESFCIAIVGVLVSLGCFFSDASAKLLDFFMKLRPQRSSIDHRTEDLADAQCSHPHCSTCRDDCDPRCRVCSEENGIFTDEALGTLVSLIFGSMCAWCGWKGEAPGISVTKGLFNFSRNFWTTIHQAGRFITSMVTLIRRLFKHIGIQSGLGTAAISLTTENASVSNFVTEANLMLDQRNLVNVGTSPTLKYRFWYIVAAAHQMVAKFTGSRLPESVSILRLANKVIEKGNALSIQSMACPVRYEPIVLALAGESKIGKSYLLQHALPKILSSEAYDLHTHAPPVFVRTPGVEFWNGYENQPCVLYDDFLAVTAPEIAVRQVIELYNLKSSAQFNLNMADLGDKKMLGNPFMVALSCNNPFAVLNGTVCPEAFLRRKEHLWQVELKAPYKTLDDVPLDVKQKNGMYNFQRYTDPSRPESLDDKIYSYDEWLDYMILSCKMYHEKEQQNVRKRLDSLQSLLPETARRMMSEVDPFRIFYASYMGAADQPDLIQSGLLPSQLIEQQLLELARLEETSSTISDITTRSSETFTFGDISPSEYDELVDEPEGVDGQLDLDNVTGTAYDWVRRICTAPNPNSLLLRPELYTRTADCPVCLSEDIQLTHGCERGHAMCSNCHTGILNASDDEQRYYCPVCRGDIFLLNETTSNAERIFRPLIWYYRLKQRGQRIRRGVLDSYQTIAQYVTEHRWAQVALTSALIVAYLSGISYVDASLNVMQGRMTDDLHNAWCDSDDAHRLTFRNRWGPIFYASTQYVSRREYRNRMETYDPENYGPIVAQMDDEQFAEAEGEVSIDNSIPHTQLTRPLHKDLVRCIWAQPEIHSISQTSCPHLRLMRYPDLSDVFYEREDDGVGRWEVGIYQSEVIYDQPCQFEVCAWKDTVSRFNFLNKWAHVHNYEIMTRKREWDRIHGTFRLPYEFITESAINIATEERSALHQAVLAYQGKTWWELCCEKLQSIGKVVKVGLMIAAGIATFVGAFKLYQHLMAARNENTGDELDANLVNSGAFHTRRLARTTFVPRSTVARAQMSEDVEIRAVRAIEKNTIFLICSYKHNGTPVVKKMRGFGLFGRTYIIPAHYAKYILTKLAKQKDKQITDLTLKVERFVNRECTSTISLDQHTFVMSNNDLAFGVTPPDFPMFKDISGYVPDIEQHQNVGGAYLHIECEEKNQVIQSVPGVVHGRIDRMKVKGTVHWDEYEIFDAYMTSYGKSGSCGSILVADLNTPLFAIHVAGHNNNPLHSTGYALPLIREDIEELKKGTAVLSYWHPILKDAADAHMQLQGALMPMGAVAKSMVAFMPKKTKIIPSLLQGTIEDGNGSKIETVTQPGILSPHDSRYQHEMSPLYHGCMKHTLPPKNFNQDTLDYCVDQISNELNEVLLPMRDISKELTLEESIHGFNDREYYDCIDLHTSAGWPWNTGTKKTKEDYITVVRDKHSKVIECKVDKNLVEVLEFNNKLREQGIRPFTVFLDWLKDERRKEKKLILKDGTRIFSLSPLDLTIQTRQMTMDFSASFMKYRERTESAVGIVVDGSEWSRLANGLLSKSPFIVTGDYSDFGPRLASQMVRAAFKIIARWYKHYGMRDPTRLRKLDVLCEEIANANHIMHDFVYQVMCGAPSGSAITVIVNSLCNMLYMRYAWMTLFPMSNEHEFKEKVFLKVYGDDLIMAVKEDTVEKFNCEVLGKLFAEYDIKFTSADKDGNEKWTTIDKATFLKSAFLRHPKIEMEWLSALEKISIFECAQWVWKSHDKYAATLENAEQSLRLAYGHGPEFFLWWRKCLNRALKNLRMKCLSLTWERVDKQFFNSDVGEYVLCSRFDDGLGLDRYAVLNDSKLKGELRENEVRARCVKFLTVDSSDEEVSMAKYHAVGERDEEEEEREK